MKLTKPVIFYSLLILLLAAICSAVIYHVRCEKYESWLPADAVVVQRDSLRKHRHRTHYIYEVDGTQYTGSAVWSDRADRSAVGEVTTVWYDPDEPSRSEHGTPTPGFDACAPFFLAIPLSVGVFLFNRRRETQPHI